MCVRACVSQGTCVYVRLSMSIRCPFHFSVDNDNCGKTLRGDFNHHVDSIQTDILLIFDAMDIFGTSKVSRENRKTGFWIEMYFYIANDYSRRLNANQSL